MNTLRRQVVDIMMKYRTSRVVEMLKDKPKGKHRAGIGLGRFAEADAIIKLVKSSLHKPK